MAVLIKAPVRVDAICRHIVRHFQEKVAPNGFKAQVVAFDRECCVLYKKAMDALVGPEASAIVMHTQGGKSDIYAEWKLAKDEEEKLLDRFRDPIEPLKFLIVTSLPAPPPRGLPLARDGSPIHAGVGAAGYCGTDSVKYCGN